MAPKIGRRKSSQQEKTVSLYDPVNTDTWKCVVMLAVENSVNDIVPMKRFVEGASLNLRKKVKSLDFECDVMRVLREFISGELSFRNGYLVNFSSVFEDAIDYVENFNKIPVSLIVKIIKAFILMMKKESEDLEVKLADHKNDRIQISAAEFSPPTGGNKQSEKEAASRKDSKGNNKEKQQKKKELELRGKSILSVKIKPHTPVKEDTKLFRRGEPAEGLDIIDDAPDNGYFQLYIIVTGFYDPELALEMIKWDIPLHCVLCLNSNYDEAQQTALPHQTEIQQIDLDNYWENFLSMLWNPDLTHFFRDVVFQVFSPEAPPADMDLKNFMYREMSFFLYDLSDLKLQHENYLRHMKLWNIDDGSDKLEIGSCLTDELDQLPHECITMPLIMQCILDRLCGEDYEDIPEERDQVSLISSDLEDSSESTSSISINNGRDRSCASVIPFYRSSVKIPSPKWSSILDDDYKVALHQKIKSLHVAYHIEGIIESEFETASEDLVCFIRKRRLPCKYLDAELQNQAGGLIAKFWSNYPIKESRFSSASLKSISDIKHPDLMMNYCLYALWLSKLECADCARRKSDSSLSSPLENHSDGNHGVNFTVTDCSRRVLQKKFEPSPGKEFFSPSFLKIVPEPLVTALSALVTKIPARVSWTEKSFVGDFHVPVKNCQKCSVTHYEDLRKFLGESVFRCLEGYDFIEELNNENLVKRIDESALDYDCVYHSYSVPTDSIYVVMYNFPTTGGVHREIYNALLPTPVGLRDFYDYILDDQREWLEEQKQYLKNDLNEAQHKSFPNLLTSTTSALGDFVESDFWHEDSIKYANFRGKSTSGAIVGKIASAQIENIPKEGKTNGKGEKEELSVKKNPTSVFSQIQGPYDFIGFDLQQGTVQFSGLETTYRGPFNSSVKVFLQERLYGPQELGIHIRQCGHVLHLYSYVCPKPHISQPYVCHIEHKKGIILAFSRRMLETRTEINDETPEASDFTESDLRNEDMSEIGEKSMQNLSDMTEDNNFAYDMKLSLPNGLTVATVRKQMYPCYIKQSYIVKSKNSPLLIQNEKNRLFLTNGSIVKIMTDNSVEVLKMDTSIVTVSLDDFGSRTSRYSPENEFDTDDLEMEDNWVIPTFTETNSNGLHYSVVNGRIQFINRFQVISNVDVVSQTKYSKRMDFTNYVLLSDGTFSVEFKDGSKISTLFYEEDWLLETDFDEKGKSTTFELYVAINVQIVMEHPRYATTIYDSNKKSWRIILPHKSEIKIFSTGDYHLDFGGKTELKIDSDQIEMWTSDSGGGLITNTTVDLTVFEENVKHDSVYCLTHDSTGRKFIVHSNGNCYVIQNDDLNRTEKGSPAREGGCEEVNSEQRKHFVVRRDLGGFEIIHKEQLKRQLNNSNPRVMVHCQRLNTLPVTRYFAFLDAIPEKGDNDERLVQFITPDAKYKAKAKERKTSSTYVTPPSWTHLFPKRKKTLELPKTLRGRIVLEVQPTDLPDPILTDGDFTFCDTSQFPEPKFSLTDRVQDILRKVALQDRRIVLELYMAAVKTRVNSKRKKQDTSAELELYLKASAHHVQQREILRNSIRYRVIPKFFDQTPEMVWLIIQDIINGIRYRNIETKINSDTARTESFKGYSEIEYNLERQSEISFSSVPFCSNLSTDTAPSSSFSPLPTNALRITKSEPIHGAEERSNKRKRHVFGDDHSRHVPPNARSPKESS